MEINYHGKTKELIFPHEYLSEMKDYKTVKLETKKGFFGFDVIEKQELNK